MPRFNIESSRGFDVQASLKLAVDIVNGRVRIRGHDQPRATVDLRLEVRGPSREWAEDEAERFAEGVRFDGDTLRIDSPGPGGGFFQHGVMQATYEISVPRETEAGVQMANGPLDVEAIAGPLDARLANGHVAISGVGSDVRVQALNALLNVKDCAAGVELTVINAPLHIERVRGPVSVVVTNGPIHAEEVDLDLSAKVVNGPIIYRGGVGGDLDLQTRNGGISLRLPSGSRFELDAESDHGHVDSDSLVSDGPIGHAATHRLRLRCGRGNIEIAQSRQPAAAPA